MEAVSFDKSIKGIVWPRSLNHFLPNLLRNISGGVLSFYVLYKNTHVRCVYMFSKNVKQSLKCSIVCICMVRFEVILKRHWFSKLVSRTEF